MQARLVDMKPEKFEVDSELGLGRFSAHLWG